MATNASQGRAGSGKDAPRGKRGGGPSSRAGQSQRGGQGKARQGKPEPVDPMVALRERLGKVLARLPETQRKVLEYRMGLVDGHPKKLTETAQALGISMSEAKQIEERAFAHIRDAIPIQHLQKFLDTPGGTDRR